MLWTEIGSLVQIREIRPVTKVVQSFNDTTVSYRLSSEKNQTIPYCLTRLWIYCKNIISVFFITMSYYTSPNVSLSLVQAVLTTDIIRTGCHRREQSLVVLVSHIPQVSWSSSVPSPQSSLPSQIHLRVMHLPFPHLNWVELHMKAPSVNDKNYKVPWVAKPIFWHDWYLLLNLHFH